MHGTVILRLKENHPCPDRQHVRPVVESERVHHVHLPPVPHTPTAGHAPEISPVHTLPQLCERDGQQYLRSTFLLPRNHRRRLPLLHGLNLPAGDALEAVGPANRTN